MTSKNQIINMTSKNQISQKVNAVAAKFSIDGGKEYQGWTVGDDWNGWACPYFEKNVADEIVKDFADSDPSYKYDEASKSYVPSDPESETFEKQTLQTSDGTKEVWAIGAYSWVWDEIKTNGKEIHRMGYQSI